jgi:hypothetical protein
MRSHGKIIWIFWIDHSAMPETTKDAWEAYRDAELITLTKVSTELGFRLDPEQVHIHGERYLQSGFKLVLTAVRISDNKRVIIKGSSHTLGKQELVYEHERRELLHSLPFAYQAFHSPQELAFIERNGLVLAVTEFINEEQGFLRNSLEDQFFLALNAFKTQEGVHATTAGHARIVRKAFESIGARDYLEAFSGYENTIQAACPENTELLTTVRACTAFLNEYKKIIDGYCGFLTHTDFVPHNLRVSGGLLYLLDYTSLVFGNKYESWARFLNYMALYHPALEHALSEYVRLNRSEYEFLSLRLMRIYKLGFLLNFYAESLPRTSGDLRVLTEKRIAFWHQAAKALLKNEQLPSSVVETYKKERDALRSEEEKHRQQILNQL